MQFDKRFWKILAITAIICFAVTTIFLGIQHKQYEEVKENYIEILEKHIHHLKYFNYLYDREDVDNHELYGDFLKNKTKLEAKNAKNY